MIQTTILTKVCNSCGVEKETSQFHASERGLFGVAGKCKTCRNIQIKEYAANNGESRRTNMNRRNRQRKEDAVKVFGNKCLDCERTYPPYVYQFHHLDPSVKDLHPSAALRKGDKGMWNELNKCVMLCANCHMIRHHGADDSVN